ncbi:hypothetical protein OG730_41230 (plasmid) [Streptomyces sp. NBC_01298]|uniref:hypothetical protein n=1 Tax=Streptomyces sp. NBC_01298 TaxID=2903817 RepID=UPI002E12D790|nr:hypothetical protein OG730_41230 [Streptomyces sp. NBC_01298]
MRARRRPAPRQAETFEVDGQEVAVGRLMTEARRPGARLEAELDGLGVPWRVQGPWDAAWQRHLVLLDLYVADGGSVEELMAGSRAYGGEDLGAWLDSQLRRGGQLDEQQVLALAKRGVVVPAKPSGAAVVRRPRGERAQAVVEAARQYVGEVGPLVDARGRHAVRADWTVTVDGVEVRLLARLNKARERRAGLEQEALEAYAGWGLGWAVDELAQRGDATG